MDVVAAEDEVDEEAAVAISAVATMMENIRTDTVAVEVAAMGGMMTPMATRTDLAAEIVADSVDVAAVVVEVVVDEAAVAATSAEATTKEKTDSVVVAEGEASVHATMTKTMRTARMIR